MNDKPNDQHPATDDQELAKVLAGVDEQVSQLPTAPADDTADAPAGGLQFEETPLASGTADVTASSDDTATVDPLAQVMPADEAAAEPTTPAVEELTVPAVEEPTLPPPPAPAAPATAASPELESLKKDALEELRPLVDKLDLPAEEKFDTMLLIIRSTDDQSLLAPAHEAAKQIADEKKRAEALLDIIKEIDYFGSQHAA